MTIHQTNDAAVGRPGPASTIDSIFSACAALTPSATAVQYRDETLSYLELDTAAERFMSMLIDRGLRPGDLVLISSPRSPVLVALLLGVLKAGGAYVAADHRWPADRLRRVQKYCRTTVVVSGAAGQELPGALLVAPEIDSLAAGYKPPDRRVPLAGSGSPCCVFFTSGSTGEPKGVLALHGGTIARFCDVSYAPFDEQTVTLQAAPLPWDGLTLELWSALLNGGRVVLHEGSSPVSGTALRRARDQGVNTLWLTSALFGSLVQEDISALGGFRQIMTGGERTPPERVRAFLKAHPGGRLLHGYGPAEATVFATAYALTLENLDGLDDVPLGFALPRTSISVRDPDRNVLPVGQIGEIHVGGAGLASGYLGDADLTRSRFVHIDGERLYRTGDLGWVDDQGRLRFVGRRDRQVKIRGNRLELQEVEAVMRSEPSVVDAHVVLRTSFTGGARLVGHYTTITGDERSAAVQAHCREHLPEYAVPASLRHHRRLPTTANGKVDVQSLAALPEESAAVAADPTLRRLQHLVSTVLDRIPDPGRDLAEQGLDSLAAMRVAYRISDRFDVAFDVSALYALRSLEAVARSLPTLPPLGRESPTVDLNPTFVGWWLREQLAPGDPAALIVSAFRVDDGTLDPAALRAAFTDLADRHEILRTHVEETAEGPRPVVAAPRTVCPFEQDDHGSQIGPEVPPAWLRPFDLTLAPGWRAWLARDHAGLPVIGLVLHHAVVDGWSEGILADDLGVAYRARAVGDEPVWPTPAGRYTELAGRPAPTRPGSDPPDFWSRQLEGTAPLELEPPSGSPGGPATGRWVLRTAAADLPELSVDFDQSAAEAAQAWILAAWAAALNRICGPVRCVVGVAYAGRDRVDDTTVGCYAELLPLALDLGVPAMTNAAAVSKNWRALLRNRAPDPAQMLAHVPRDRQRRTFQIAFALQTNPPPRLDLGAGVRAGRVELNAAASLYPLLLEAWLDDGAITVRLEWDRLLVADSLAEVMRENLTHSLRGLGLNPRGSDG